MVHIPGFGSVEEIVCPQMISGRMDRGQFKQLAREKGVFFDEQWHIYVDGVVADVYVIAPDAAILWVEIDEEMNTMGHAVTIAWPMESIILDHHSGQTVSVVKIKPSRKATVQQLNARLVFYGLRITEIPNGYRLSRRPTFFPWHLKKVDLVEKNEVWRFEPPRNGELLNPPYLWVPFIVLDEGVVGLFRFDGSLHFIPVKKVLVVAG